MDRAKIKERGVGEKNGELIRNGSKKGLLNWQRADQVEGDEDAFE